ncbi:MAG: cytochrome C biogenesis protein [Variibacter sp.]|nr:cytochrome C biogenesis protein [Variibacter sp.]
MHIRPFHCAAFAAALFAASCLAAAKEAHGAEASPWQRGPHAAVRLIGGTPERGSEGTIRRAGVEIALDPGWKTYWRYPGDSGIPPRFDFAGSVNVKDVQVLWPAPIRFSDGAGTSIGYAGHVVFPLRVRPRDPDAPVTLRLKLDYAICETLCVPADASVELSLDGTTSPYDDLIRASEARVPRKARIGGDGPLAIASVRRERSPKPRIVVDVRTPDGAELFAEGPDERWSLPLPEPVAGAAPGTMRFAFALEGLPAGADAAGARLTLTAVSAADAVEVSFHLD